MDDAWVTNYCACGSIKELHDWLVEFLQYQQVGASDIVQLSHGVALGQTGAVFSGLVIVRQRRS